MPQNREHLDNIMDTMAGADGGGRFLQLRFFLEHLELENSEASDELMKVMIRFSKLIEAANRK